MCSRKYYIHAALLANTWYILTSLLTLQFTHDRMIQNTIKWLLDVCSDVAVDDAPRSAIYILQGFTYQVRRCWVMMITLCSKQIYKQLLQLSAYICIYLQYIYIGMDVSHSNCTDPYVGLYMQSLREPDHQLVVLPTRALSIHKPIS